MGRGLSVPLQRYRTVQDAAPLRIPEKPVKTELDEIPTLEETIKAIHQLKGGKAAGIDGFQPNVWKHGGPVLHSKLQ